MGYIPHFGLYSIFFWVMGYIHFGLYSIWVVYPILQISYGSQCNGMGSFNAISFHPNHFNSISNSSHAMGSLDFQNFDGIILSIAILTEIIPRKFHWEPRFMKVLFRTELNFGLLNLNCQKTKNAHPNVCASLWNAKKVVLVALVVQQDALVRTSIVTKWIRKHF